MRGYRIFLYLRRDMRAGADRRFRCGCVCFRLIGCDTIRQRYRFHK